jgi:hypothetical protein
MAEITMSQIVILVSSPPSATVAHLLQGIGYDFAFLSEHHDALSNSALRDNRPGL